MKKEGAAEMAQPIEAYMNDRGIHEAVCIRNGWKPGKSMAESEYRKAVSDFMAAPAGSFRARRKK